MSNLRCPRCNRIAYFDVDEKIRGEMVLNCFNCGPQYGRRAATEEDGASLHHTIRPRQRYRGPSRDGAKL